jgi:DNA polymerase-3 subunit chi
MTRIDFYVLQSHDSHVRRVMVCRLIEKAFRQGHTIFVRTGSEAETNLFDDLLWTFRQGSFVPHELVTDPDREAPVVIGHEAPPVDMHDVMVNVGLELVPGFEAFERVAELVDQDEAVRQAGRLRYKSYQSQGYPLHTHQLDTTVS